MRVCSIDRDSLNNSVSRETEEFNIACGHYSRLLRSQAADVLRVEAIEYSDGDGSVAERFRKCREDFAVRGLSTAEIWVFHGTNSAAVRQIIQNGFKVGGTDPTVPVRNGASYGKGVYTAVSPGTPMGYGVESRSIILARGIPGDMNTHHRPHTQPDWYIFRSAAQLLPCYIVHF